MLDIKKIAESKQKVIDNLKRRGTDFSSEIDEILVNYEKYLVDLKVEEENQSQINKLSKEIGILKQKGEDASDVLAKIEDLKDKMVKANSKKYKEKYEDILMYLPNMIADDVPFGQDEDDNEEVEVVGVIPKFSFEPKAHYKVESAKKDFHFDKAGEISKSRFVITTNFLAKLERAITTFMLDTHTSRGYEEVTVPVIVNSSTLENSGNLPKFANDLFKIENNSKSDKEKDDERDFYLIPTAETVLANFHRDSIIEGEALSKNYTAYSQCFRKEAGSAGKDTSGIIRMHQFGKVELFKFTKQEDSDQALKDMLNDAKYILDELKLPYRVVKLCSGDIGFSANKTFDLEVWLPAQNKYRECSSVSCVTDFQARRGKIRYKDVDGSKKLVHMLNGSGMATGRILAAVIENYQNEDGSITIPEVLQKYFN